MLVWLLKAHLQRQERRVTLERREIHPHCRLAPAQVGSSVRKLLDCRSILAHELSAFAQRKLGANIPGRHELLHGAVFLAALDEVVHELMDTTRVDLARLGPNTAEKLASELQRLVWNHAVGARLAWKELGALHTFL